MRKYFAWWLFISSYAPLFLIWAIINITTPTNVAENINWLEYIKLCLSVQPAIVWFLLGFIFIALFPIPMVFHAFNRIAGTNVTISKVENAHGEAMAYVATYVIPFVSSRMDRWNDIISNFLLVCVIGTIYVNSNLLYTNPILLWFKKLVIFRCLNDAGDPIVLISKQKPVIGVMTLVHIADNIYYRKS